MTVTAEERAAVDWLESLSPAQRIEHFRPNVAATIGYAAEDMIGQFATLKDDHENDRAHCVACKDPNAVVIE